MRPQGEALICILRRGERLTALVLREMAAASPPGPRSPWRPHGPEAGPALVERPLAEVPEALVPRREALLASWQWLSAAGGWTPQTLFHLVRILAETLPGEEVNAGPFPALDEPAPAPRATAAHPRAYRGTLRRPPKPPAPLRRDLRAHLSSARGPAIPKEALARLFEPAAALLRDDGYAPDELCALERATRGADLLLARRHGDPTRAAKLPAAFARLAAILPGEPGTLGRLLKLRGRLAIERDPEMFAAAATLTATAGPHALPWLEQIARAPAERQAVLARLLAQSGAWRRWPSGLEPELLRMHEACPDARFAHRAWTLFDGLARGLSGEFLLAGFRLADLVQPDHAFALPPTDAPVPEETIAGLAAHCEYGQALEPWHMMGLWRQLGALPGLDEVVASTRWTALAPRAAARLAKVLAEFVDADDSDVLPRWRALRQSLPQWLQLVESLPPPYQEKPLAILESFGWNADASRLARALPAGLDFARRVARPPLLTANVLSFALEEFLVGRDADLPRKMLAAGDASFRTFEEACSRRNAAGLIGDGMKVLVQCLPDLALKSFHAHSRALARLARRLGLLRGAEAWATVEAAARDRRMVEPPPEGLGEVALVFARCVPRDGVRGAARRPGRRRSPSRPASASTTQGSRGRCGCRSRGKASRTRSSPSSPPRSGTTGSGRARGRRMARSARGGGRLPRAERERRSMGAERGPARGALCPAF